METVIFPNPNQMILLRSLQREICCEWDFLPVLPIFLKSEKLTGFNAKITKIEIDNLEKIVCGEKEIVFLKVSLEINGENADGKIVLGEKDSDSEKGQTDIKQPSDNDENLLSLKSLKKLSPFKISEIETEELENGRRWKITREKWGKLR